MRAGLLKPDISVFLLFSEKAEVIRLLSIACVTPKRQAKAMKFGAAT